MSAIYANNLWSDITISGNTRYRDPLLDSLISATPVRVLIISELNQCVTIAALVHSIGQFYTRMACSAESALRLAGDFVPDIVLLTIALPDRASYEVAAALRWRSGRPAPRLIALTDDIAASDRGRVLSAGFEQYVAVPVERAALECALLRGASGVQTIGRNSSNTHN